MDKVTLVLVVKMVITFLGLPVKIVMTNALYVLVMTGKNAVHVTLDSIFNQFRMALIVRTPVLIRITQTVSRIYVNRVFHLA